MYITQSWNLFVRIKDCQKLEANLSWCNLLLFVHIFRVLDKMSLSCCLIIAFLAFKFYSYTLAWTNIVWTFLIGLVWYVYSQTFLACKYWDEISWKNHINFLNSTCSICLFTNTAYSWWNILNLSYELS